MLFIESLIIALTISIDSFFVSLTYGSKRIKIPLISILIINLTSVILLGLILLFGELIKGYISEDLCKLISFLILFIIGLIRLADIIIKVLIRKYLENKKIKFKIFNLIFILDIYANPLKADVDRSRTISAVEAFSLAIALSLDSIALGLALALGSINIIYLIINAFIIGNVAIILGLIIGKKIIKIKEYDLSWLSGLILIILALLKL